MMSSPPRRFNSDPRSKSGGALYLRILAIMPALWKNAGILEETVANYSHFAHIAGIDLEIPAWLGFPVGCPKLWEGRAVAWPE